MQLSYRGIQYNQPSIAVDVKAGTTFAKYRGQYYQISNFDNLFAKKPHSRRIYRGISYN